MKKLFKGVVYLFVFAAIYGFAKQGVSEISADLSAGYSGITSIFSNEPERVEIVEIVNPVVVETLEAAPVPTE